MKLGTRILLAASGAVVLATTSSITTVYFVSSHNRVAEHRQQKLTDVLSTL